MPRAWRHPLSAIVVLVALAVPSAARADDLSAIGQQIVVRQKASLDAGDRADLREDADVRLARSLPISGVDLVTADPGERSEALEALRADPDVLWAEPNRPVSAFTTDPYFSLQWSLLNTGQSGGTPDDDIDADDAWGASRGAGITIGVVDTGADATHPDLNGQVVAGRNWVTGQTTTDTSDGNGHGTHVTGIIAAAENTTGIAGIAPAAQVMPLRVLNASGNGSSADVASAFAYAGDLGLRVVNASLGATTPTQVESDAIAAHPGTLYVVAAGNGDSNGIGQNVESVPTYPCSYTYANILCVGASDRNDAPATFSNYGTTSVDLFAPGVRILSTYPSNQYAFSDGTSMASPEVAAAAALVAAAHPSFSAIQLKQALLNSVDHPAGLVGKSVTGGRLNAASALVTANGGSVTGAPAPPTGVLAQAGLESVTVSWAANGEPDLAGYRIWRRADSGTWIAGPRTMANSLTTTGISGGTTATFRVTAINGAGGESAPSATVSAMATARPPAAQAAEPAPAPSTGAVGTTLPVPTMPLNTTLLVAPAPPKVSALALVTSGSGTMLRVTMTRAATVTIRVRRTVRKRTRTVTTKMKLQAGLQSLKLTKSILGVKPAGLAAQVTVIAAGNQRSIRVKLR